MRHIQLNDLIAQISTTEGKADQKKLSRAHKAATTKCPDLRKVYIRKNGPKKWTPIKDRFTSIVGNKCWYTEVELIGAPLAIDHYRPVCDYWWLAFDVENYRVSCPYFNSPKHNAEHGCAGGKGDNFPLLAPGQRATEKNKLYIENPVILDPCKPEDCELLAFQSDGRPVVNPVYAADSIAARRVEESKILLNLDHPDFNAKREQLCREIFDDVRAHEELPVDAVARNTIRTRLASRLGATAPFSTAARYYIRLHRHLGWVENLLATS